MENNKHAGNYTGTTNTNAKNQDLAFVNDTLENAPSLTTINLAKDDISEANEENQLNQK
ncbi:MULTISPECIES: hypothetical protein [Paenibacillus]|uniref:Uncharacterized protein n=1 Tax=Paenibacillus alba TaxID=1197127 RepID=A0ABU6FYY8_9BACL|nr:MULTISPECIES: hypothetical protein [Paenibacillus]MEC0227121.1 hypothetical protein [Paenibacillus alba]NQX64506.1 hypothetical protein [Paenibacillus alba]